MQVLWQLEIGTVKDIIEQFPHPKPAYNTISTIIRILENKEFVSHKQFGKGYRYYPLLDKETYSNQRLNKLINGYFEGSFKGLVSFFVKQNDIDIKELESILKELNNKQ